MYSIGEFSKINRITPKTLRHYDKIGLLKPAKIDDWTGYRFYQASQLPRIQKILMLRDMGFSLTEIQEMMERQDQSTDLLRRHERQLMDHIRQEKQRLKRLREYLLIMEGDEQMKEEVTIQSLPEVMVASMRTVVPGYDSYFDIVPKMGEYMNSVGAVCREPAYCFTIYHDGEYKESDIDVEICEAVVEAKEESEQVKFKTIEEVAQAASLNHRGPYETIGESYNKLFAWVDEQGFRAVDNPRECYINGIWNREDPQQWLTQIQLPIEEV